jgi:hypothetical protein
MAPQPVLFLVFNRPAQTERVFAEIRRARPERLYVAADGARTDREEGGLCEQVRAIATDVDWPCVIKTLFQEHNLGCKEAVASAISWFFEHEEQGIILEDDCLPHPSFFPFCDDLLARYHSDERVMSICGSNSLPRDVLPESDYYFSRHCRVWGWATWRRAWQYYDKDMVAWPELRQDYLLRSVSGGDYQFERYWQEVFDRTHAGEIDTWDFQWMFSCWAHSGLAIRPSVNLISNLGFGPDATHTFDEASQEGNRETFPLHFPMRHPGRIARDVIADQQMQITHFSTARLWRFYRRVRSKLTRMGAPSLERALELRRIARLR